jgi:hypothetical protein
MPLTEGAKLKTEHFLCPFYAICYTIRSCKYRKDKKVSSKCL